MRISAGIFCIYSATRCKQTIHSSPTMEFKRQKTVHNEDWRLASNEVATHKLVLNMRPLTHNNFTDMVTLFKGYFSRGKEEHWRATRIQVDSQDQQMQVWLPYQPKVSTLKERLQLDWDFITVDVLEVSHQLSDEENEKFSQLYKKYYANKQF